MTCRLFFVCLAIWFSIAERVHGRGRAEDEVHGYVLGAVGGVQRLPLFTGFMVMLMFVSRLSPQVEPAGVMWSI